MGFFDNLGKGITDFSQTTIQKGKDAASIVRLNRMISAEESNIAKLYENLGRMYYALRYPDPADPQQPEISPEEDMEACAAAISESQEQILAYREEIKKLQGVTQCISCGADVPEGASFCPACGQKTAYEEAREQAAASKPEKIFCTNCGAQLVPGYKFCASCGTKVEEPAADMEQPEEESGEPEVDNN